MQTQCVQVRKAAVLSAAWISLQLAVVPAAQAGDRWYAGITGVSGSLEVSSLRAELDSGAAAPARLEADSGFGWGGAFGREFGQHWRLEGEIMYRSNDLSELTFSDGGSYTKGDYASLVFAANAYYAFGAANASCRPYLGGGLGLIQEVDIDLEDSLGESSFSGDGVAAQVMAGVSYRPSERWSIDFEARYLTASGLDLEAENGPVGGRVKADYDVFTLGASLRYLF